MTVLFVEQTVPRKGAVTSQRKGLLAEIINRTFTLEFLVGTSDPNDGPAVVLAAPSLPVLGSTYAQGNDIDPLATCTAVRANGTAHPLLWKVEADFDTERLITNAFNHPLNAPAEVSWDFISYTRPMVRDARGVSVTNSSNEKYEPGAMMEDTRPVLRVTRNEATFDPALALLYQDATNSDVFAGALPGTAKVQHITGKRQVDVGLVYHSVTYEISFRRESFVREILDTGFRNARGQLFYDTLTNTPLANSSSLNGRGYQLARGQGNLVGAIGPGNQSITVNLKGPVDETWPPLVTEGAVVVPPPDSVFEFKVDEEVIRVIDSVPAGAGEFTWTVVRGFAGSLAAAHAAAAPISLEPYFRRYVEFKLLPFAPLNLPV